MKKGLSRHDIFFKTLSEQMDQVLVTLMSQVSSCGFPVYTSLDIRDAGWKVCAVDVNLFPAGFNLLSSGDRQNASKRIREFFSAKLFTPPPWRITVVPEAHTNNQGYLRNLSGILDLLKEAGVEAKLLWPGPAIPQPWDVKTAEGKTLRYLPPALALEGSQALLLNHDLSGGVPEAIKDIDLPTYPSKNLGWFKRRKSKHFEIADSILDKIAEEHEFFDPWYFSTSSVVIQDVDFDSDDFIKNLAHQVQQLIDKLHKDYGARGIQEKPYLFLKNDAGTYGMGVQRINSATDVLEGVRKLRTKMKKGKESVPVSQIILQEGIPTALHYNDPSLGPVAGEPVVYMIHGLPIGGFIRLHEGLGEDARFENLNQPGSILESIDLSQSQDPHRPFPQPRGIPLYQQLQNRELYSFVSRLHAVAASLEDCTK